MKLSHGDVLEGRVSEGGSDRLKRVLLFDEIEIIYDVWWESLGWGLRRIKRNGGGYRMLAARANDHELLRNEPLTEKEKAAFRPDLPMRLCRHPTLNWSAFDCGTPDEIPARMAQCAADFPVDGAINAPGISLLFAPGHSLNVTAVKVAARDGSAVPIVDLLWHAQKLIADAGHEAPDGIGLFRMLRWAGSPAYFVRGYHNFCTWIHAGEDPRKEPEWTTRRRPLSGDLKARLMAVKKLYPFASWRDGEEGGLDQYTRENCDAAKATFDRLIKQLIALGEAGAEDAKLALFREAVEGLNELNAEVLNLIESGERDQLCELFNEIARAVGLEPTKYGGGEGPASEWRDW